MGDKIYEGYGADGTIDQLKDTCETRGWKLVAKLTGIKHGSVGEASSDKPANIAEYESETFRKDIWKNLHFIAMVPTDVEGDLKKTWQDKGEVWIFTEQLFVESKLKQVMGFGIPNS